MPGQQLRPMGVFFQPTNRGSLLLWLANRYRPSQGNIFQPTMRLMMAFVQIIGQQVPTNGDIFQPTWRPTKAFYSHCWSKTVKWWKNFWDNYKTIESCHALLYHDWTADICSCVGHGYWPIGTFLFHCCYSTVAPDQWLSSSFIVSSATSQ